MRSNFVFVDLAEDMVAEFSAKGFEFIDRIEVEQATVVVANALRAHQNIFVSGSADVLDGLFVNGVKCAMSMTGASP